MYELGDLLQGEDVRGDEVEPAKPIQMLRQNELKDFSCLSLAHSLDDHQEAFAMGYSVDKKLSFYRIKNLS